MAAASFPARFFFAALFAILGAPPFGPLVVRFFETLLFFVAMEYLRGIPRNHEPRFSAPTFAGVADPPRPVNRRGAREGAGGGHLLPAHAVSYEEILNHLSAQSDVPSTFGHQLAEQQRRILGPESERLERARRKDQTREEEEARLWHTMPVKDRPGGYRIDENANVERSLFTRTRVLNCVGALTRYRVLTFVRAPDVEAFARAARCAQGAVVVGALRAYEQFRERAILTKRGYEQKDKSERGLAALYAWMAEWNPRHRPVEHDEDSTAQAFRAGKANGARRRAAGLLADSEIALAEWVDLWNKRSAKARLGDRDLGAHLAVMLDAPAAADGGALPDLAHPEEFLDGAHRRAR